MPADDHEDRHSAPDPERRRLIRSAFVSSPLESVAGAVSVASDEHRSFYVDRDDDGWRWSPATGGGPYPLLRITARFLLCSHFRIMVGRRTVGDGVRVLMGECDEQRPNRRWAILDLDGPVSPEVATELIRTALRPDRT